ncbi:MAG: hypothetical protein PHV66_09045 [Bacteroidales bacterium]|nr:hypothetical protein [Bacteroidales bacterium]
MKKYLPLFLILLLPLFACEKSDDQELLISRSIIEMATDEDITNTAIPPSGFYNPYSYAGNVKLKGQMHCHSTNSADGNYSPSELAAMFKEAGYDFFTITDHDYITTEPPGNELIWLCNSYESTQKAHLCVYNAGSVLKGVLSIEDVIDYQVYKRSAVVGLAHPGWLKYPVATEDLITSCKGTSFVEVWNGTMNTSLGENGTGAWDTMLSNNQRVLALAVDDLHAAGHLKKGWVEVLSMSRNRNDIMFALLKGAFYATNGATIDAVEYRSDTITIRTGSSTAITAFYGMDGVQLGDKIVGENAQYRIMGSEKYVRAVVENKGKYCWTQPVFLK